MGRKKHRVMSSTQKGETGIGGNSDESIDELRRELGIRDATINEMREKLREQEVENLRKQVEMLQASLVNRSSTSSENVKPNENLSFGDIEQSITKFSGREGEVSIKSWVKDFENSAEIFGWSQLKHVKENAAELRELLQRRKKRSFENYEEYFLSIRELGRRTNLEENAIIKYAIDGIEEDENLKIVLYGANGIQEFKEKLRVFSKICGNVKRSFSKKQKTEPVRRKVGGEIAKLRCYACGKEGHIARDCPKKNVGNKCFICNSFGHKSTECPKERFKEYKKEVAFISSQVLRENMLKRIKVNKVEFDAFIDTGSELSFISDEVHQKLNSPCLTCPITFRGVGSDEIATVGAFTAELAIDNSIFKEKLHVVAGSILPKGIIIGRTLLNRTKLTVTPKSISLEPESIVVDEFSCLNIEAADDLDIGPVSNDDYRERIIRMVEAYSPKKKVELSNFEMRIV